MIGRIRRIRSRIVQLFELTNQISALQQNIAQLQEENRNLRDVLREIHAITDHTQKIAGETLSALNEEKAFNNLRFRRLPLTDHVYQALGRIESRLSESATEWNSLPFSVYSQFGEDGIIQFLLRQIAVSRKEFVEIGVEDYLEANTRFLLLYNRWKGVLIECDENAVAKLVQDAPYRSREIQVVREFVTRENINSILCDAGVSGSVGLLSIDIDGNDYWVWEASEIVADIVIIEYNFRFGPDPAVAVPYDPDFNKNSAHPSGIYYGASLKALTLLAEKKGYALIGCSDGGVNAFFVRRDKLGGSVRATTVHDAFVFGQHMEMRNAEGELVRASWEEQHHLLMSLPLVRFEGEA
ncbi:MAG: hypothetical protein OHK0029_00840 [Armatimonadaceae bacterium]